MSYGYSFILILKDDNLDASPNEMNCSFSINFNKFLIEDLYINMYCDVLFSSKQVPNEIRNNTTSLWDEKYVGHRLSIIAVIVMSDGLVLSGETMMNRKRSK